MEQIRFKESILPPSLDAWKITNGHMGSGKVTLFSGGELQFVKAPSNDEESIISETYKLMINFAELTPAIYNSSKITFEIHMVPKDKTQTYKTITMSAHPNDIDGVLCTNYFNTKGGTVELIKVILKNKSNSDINISAVKLYPSYNVDEETLKEIEQHIPSIVHATNIEPITIVSNLQKIVELNASTAMDSNLLVHFMANGTVTEDCTAILHFMLGKKDLPYSPLSIPLKSGPFLIGIPANIMQVEPGENKFEVMMELTNGTARISENKVQLTVDGKGMVSKSSSAAPSIIELERTPEFENVCPDTNMIPSHSFLSTVIEPLQGTIHKENIHIIDVVKQGRGKPTTLVGTRLTKVADDIWFGPEYENGWDNGENEKFIHTNVVVRLDGAMQLKPSNAISKKMKLELNGNKGDLFSIELDNTQVRGYERLTIDVMKQSIDIENTLSEEITIKNKYDFTIDNVTQLNRCTHGDIVIEDSNYTVIDSIE